MTHHEDSSLRDEIIQVCRLMHSKGFVAATDGNVSARLDAAHLLVTPSGFSKGLIQADELLVVDLEGREVGEARDAGGRPLRCTSEIRLHLEVYRQRPEARAVVHAHPPITVALSIAGVPIAHQLLPEVVLSLGDIPTTEYATPSSAAGADVIRPLIKAHDALVLPRHGIVTLGATPTQAYLKLEKVEHAAEITLILRLLGVEAPMPAEEMAKLSAMRRR